MYSQSQLDPEVLAKQRRTQGAISGAAGIYDAISGGVGQRQAEGDIEGFVQEFDESDFDFAASADSTEEDVDIAVEDDVLALAAGALLVARAVHVAEDVREDAVGPVARHRVEDAVEHIHDQVEDQQEGGVGDHHPHDLLRHGQCRSVPRC